MLRRSAFQLMVAFFGLTPSDREDLILEPFFLITWHIGMDWNTYYNLPVLYKKWLIERLAKELEKGRDSNDMLGQQNNSQTMNNRFKKFS